MGILRQKSPTSLFVARCLGLLMAFGSALPTLAEDAPKQGETTEEANKIADQAFKDFEAKKFRQAAEGFMRAYELSGARFPKQLRNAAKALHAGGFLEEALEVWQRIEVQPGVEVATRDEARGMMFQLKTELGARYSQQAEAARRGKRAAQAGDLYVRGFEMSEGTRTDLLISAAQAYESVRQLDDAHIAWHMSALALIAHSDAQKAAAAGEERLFALLRNVAGASAGYTAFQEKRWADAAAQLARAYDQNHERASLRHAAWALQVAGRPEDAESAWQRYEQAAQGSHLAIIQARTHLQTIRSDRLLAEAKAASAANRHGPAGEKWVALFELSKGTNFEALRQAALEFERQGDLERSRSWWQRLADTAQAPEAMRKEAAEHAAGKVEVAVKLPASPTPTGDGEKQPGAGEHVVKAAPPPATCENCWMVMAGGGVLAAVGGVLIGLTHANQSDLLALAANKDATGAIVDVNHDDAIARQASNNTKNTAGIGLAVAGVAVAGGALIWQMLLPKSTVTPVVMPTEHGAGAILVLRW